MKYRYQKEILGLAQYAEYSKNVFKFSTARTIRISLKEGIVLVPCVYIMEGEGSASLAQENIRNICVICPHKSYVTPEEILSSERTTLKRKRGVKNCNKYAKKRKMDLRFKVCGYFKGYMKYVEYQRLLETFSLLYI